MEARTTPTHGGAGEATTIGTKLKRNCAFERTTMLTQIPEHANVGTAAAKVFSLPALVEIILIEIDPTEKKLPQSMADMNGPAWRCRDCWIAMKGFRSLFELQRVNKLFYTTINNAPKLRRIMFKKGTDKQDDLTPILNPLCFDPLSFGDFSHRVLYPAELDEWMVDGWYDADDEDIETAEHGPYLTLHCHGGNLSGPAPASWRELKLCHSATARKIATELSIGSYHKNFFGEISTDSTLGDFAEAAIYKHLRKAERRSE